MHRDYQDIISRLGPPLWWDKYAVPRYEPFHPDLCGVYDDHVALIELACQGCLRRLLVSAEVDRATHYLATKRWKVLFPTQDDAWDFDQWHDPPHHGCIGDTMNSGIYRIVEFWSKGDSWPPTWTRQPEYEFDYGDQPWGGESLGGA